MSYATLAQLEVRYGTRLLLQLTDRAKPPAGVIDVDVVDRALTDADATIDGYLAGRYILPLAETPPLVTDWAQAIAIYKLHTFAPDAKIEQDYKDVIGALKDVAKGVITLSVAGVAPAGSDAGGVVTTDRERPFTAEGLKGFI